MGIVAEKEGAEERQNAAGAKASLIAHLPPKSAFHISVTSR